MNTAAKPGDIHLHIDTLVLRGFDGINKDALMAALHAALRTELSTLAALPRNGDISRAHTTVNLADGAGNAQLSAALAQTLSGMVRAAGGADTPVAEIRHD